jgi:peptide/nickel transport system substrate-binding protein
MATPRRSTASKKKATPRQATPPKQLVYTLEGDPESLDFAHATSLRSERVSWLLCDTLVDTSPTGKVKPTGLAKIRSLSPSGMVYEFTLIDGVRFHDGTPLDAQAVIDNIQRQLSPGRTPSVKGSILAGLIRKITRNSNLAFELELSYPSLHYLSEVHLVSPTALKSRGPAFGRNPVGSGPFIFKRWTPGTEIVLTANKDYWGGPPKLGKVVFRIIPDEAARVQALIKGKADFVPAVSDPELLALLKKTPGVTLLPTPGWNLFYLGFYCDRPPFDAAAARRAVARAITTADVVATRGLLIAKRTNRLLPAKACKYQPAIPQAGDRAPLPAGPLGLVFNQAVPLIAKEAAAIQRDLASIGTQVRLLGKPSFPEVLTAVRAREGHMFIYNWHVSAVGPERVLKPLFHSDLKGISNLTHYSNPDVDRKLADAALDPALYPAILAILDAEAPVVPLHDFKRRAAMSNRVLGLALKSLSSPADKLLKVRVR